MDDRLKRLRALLAEASNLTRAAQVLGWDQQTHMPPGGARARADQLATLERLAHEAMVRPEMGELLNELEAASPWEEGAAEADLVRIARRLYERDVRVPPDLVSALSRASSEGYQAWMEARRQNDFDVFRPHLERLVDLQAQKADALGWRERRYDALLDLFETELRTSTVEQVFAGLREGLRPVIEAIAARQDAVDGSLLERRYDDDKQWAFTVELLQGLGFDFDRGRQDRSPHPFTAPVAVDDARITTRVQENWLPAALFATIHEAGHAFYEQGVPRDWEGTPLSTQLSHSVHESQSRLWENVVGRSREFWRHFLPRLRDYFPAQLEGASEEDFYRAVNRVRPSLIRVEADEVTYCMHIFLRFELEQAMLDGDLTAADLPGAWEERMRAYLGLTPPDANRGVLQDVHWSNDVFGYFPTYALGTLLSVQVYEAALADLPDLPERFARGDFGTLRQWLRDNVHAHGARYTLAELVRRVTGNDLESGPFLRYVRRKYGEIYGLDSEGGDTR